MIALSFSSVLLRSAVIQVMALKALTFLLKMFLEISKFRSYVKGQWISWALTATRELKTSLGRVLKWCFSGENLGLLLFSNCVKLNIFFFSWRIEATFKSTISVSNLFEVFRRLRDPPTHSKCPRECGRKRSSCRGRQRWSRKRRRWRHRSHWSWCPRRRFRRSSLCRGLKHEFFLRDESSSSKSFTAIRLFNLLLSLRGSM